MVVSNSNNGNVMVSHSVSGYHAHFRNQDRKREMKQWASCCVVWYLLLESFVCHINKKWMSASSREFEIDLKEKENDAFGKCLHVTKTGRDFVAKPN